MLGDLFGGLEASIDTSVSGPDSIRTVDPYSDPIHEGKNYTQKYKILCFKVLDVRF